MESTVAHCPLLTSVQDRADLVAGVRANLSDAALALFRREIHPIQVADLSCRAPVDRRDLAALIATERQIFLPAPRVIPGPVPAVLRLRCRLAALAALAKRASDKNGADRNGC